MSFCSYWGRGKRVENFCLIVVVLPLRFSVQRFRSRRTTLIAGGRKAGSSGFKHVKGCVCLPPTPHYPPFPHSTRIRFLCDISWISRGSIERGKIRMKNTANASLPFVEVPLRRDSRTHLERQLCLCPHRYHNAIPIRLLVLTKAG